MTRESESGRQRFASNSRRTRAYATWNCKTRFRTDHTGDFKDVRSFAIQIRHTAASNYAIWSGITGDKFPKDYVGGDGPANLKSKCEIVSFLKDSFSLGHKAAALTPENMLENAGRNTRLHLLVFGLTHAMDHDGQMVEYLRMNGIIPPGSR